MNSSILRLFSIALVGSLIGKFIRYFTNIVIGRAFGPEALGVFTTGIVLLSIGSVIGRFGLDNAAQKYIPIYSQRENQEKVFSIILVCLTLTLLLSIVITLFGIFTIEFFNIGKNGTGLKIFFLGIAPYGVMTVGMSATRGFKETKYAVYIRDLGQSVFALLGVIVVVLTIHTTEGLAIAYVVSTVIGASLAIIFIANLSNYDPSYSLDIDYKELAAYSVPVLFVAVVNQALSWTDILMLNILENSYAVGQYQAVFETSATLILLQQSANALFPSFVSDYYHRDEDLVLSKIYTGLTKHLLWLGIAGGGFLYLYSGPVLSIFGENFDSLNSIYALRVLIIGQVFAVGFGLAGPFLIMAEYERAELVNSTISAILNIALNYIFIHQYGVLGAAIATAFTIGLVNTIRIIQVNYFIGIHPFSTSYWKGGISATGALVMMLIFPKSPFGPLKTALFAGIIGLSTFILLTYFLGFSSEDRALIRVLK